MHIELEDLKLFATGRLSDADAERIESHLSECDDCGRRLDEIDVAADKLLGILRKAQSTADFGRAASDLGATKAPVRPPSLDSSPGEGTKTGQFGRYEIRDELGRGGMGLVYAAYDPTLRRFVALKIITPQRVAREEDRARFRREAESAARLQHANIVQIFEFGEQEGALYCVFELVAGGSLAERLDQQSLPPTEAAAMTATLADALQYAHQRKVIHRDLKPANILFTADRTPKIADFGLAKILDDEVRQTVDGTLLGSPCYMAPEQAEGNLSNVGPASDIYALGAILYESLAGHPPFRGGSLLATLDLVKHTDPTPPSRFRREVDRDLETVCLKCLEKSPSRRYGSAAELAADLRRYLDGLPVMARQAGWWSRGMKLAKRHPFAATVSALFAVFLAAFVVTVTLYSVWLRGALRDANDRGEIARRNMYSLQLQRADAVAAIDPQQAQRLLDDPQRCPEDLRDFTWGRLQVICRRELAHWQTDGEVRCLAVAPDGITFASGNSRGVVQLWSTGQREPHREIHAHRQAITDVAFAPDGMALATCSEDGTASLWKLTGEDAPVILTALTPAVENADEKKENSDVGHINGVAFSPDGTQLATAHSDGTVRVWSLPAGRELIILRGHEASVFRVDFSPDGQYLVSGSRDESLRLWEVKTWNERVVIADHSGFVTDVKFHPHDSRRLASSGADRTVRLWTVTTEHKVEPDKVLRSFDGIVSGLAFARDGDYFAAGSYDRSAQIWHTASGQPAVALRQHSSDVTCVVFDGQANLLAGTKAGRIHRWSIQQASPLLIQAHQRSITGLVYLDGGETLASSGYDGAICLWNAADGKQVAEWRRPDQWVTGIVSTADGRQIAWESGGVVYTARCDGSSSFQPQPVRTEPQLLTALSLTRTGSSLVLADFAGLRSLPAAGGAADWTWSADDIACLACSPTDDTVVAAGHNHQIWIGNSTSGRFAAFPSLKVPLRCLAFSWDGRFVGVGSVTGEAAIHEVATGKIVLRITGHAGAITCLAFSPDAKTLATASDDGNVWLWDSVAGPARGKLAIGRAVRAVVFSPDSRHLACGDDAGVIQIWNAEY